MARPTQRKFVDNSSPIGTAVTTTAPTPFQLTNPFPVGDIVYADLNLRWRGTFTTTTGGGDIVPDGGLQFLRAIYFSTPQHGMIWENLDGIMVADMMEYENGKRGSRDDITDTAAAANPTFEYYLRIPFKDPMAFDAQDTGLDVLRSGAPLLQINLGINTDFVSGGDSADAVATTSRLESWLRLDPGAIDPASEAPQNWQPYRGVLRIPISATAAQYSIYLAFGDRIIKRLYVTQRNNSTLARLANTVVGAAETDQLSLKLNANFPWVDRVGWFALQEENAYDAGLDVMPLGVAVVDFFQKILGGSANGRKGGVAGAKLSDALSVLDRNQGTLELLADVTSVSNGALWIGYDAVKVLAAGARRPAPQPAT